MKQIFVKYDCGRCDAYRVDLYGVEKGIAHMVIWDMWSEYYHKLKVYYRPERTWDDHIGNTPCGYYVNLPLPNGSKRRWYLYD